VPETIIIDNCVEATTLEEVMPPLVVKLWPGQAPEEPGTIGEERKFPSKPNKDRSETTEVTQLITNVTRNREQEQIGRSHASCHFARAK
jgi:hypothetical protein